MTAVCRVFGLIQGSFANIALCIIAERGSGGETPTQGAGPPVLYKYANRYA
jgi:hypothetical protein